jgi:hypothetical protein
MQSLIEVPFIGYLDLCVICCQMPCGISNAKIAIAVQGIKGLSYTIGKNV